jgi:antitoxin CptB
MKLKNIKNISMAKLAWACRRGMLELDVLLGNFLKQRFSDLSLTDKDHFVALLQYPDPLLFDWLMGRAVPAAELGGIVEQIRSHARSRI